MAGLELVASSAGYLTAGCLTHPRVGCLASQTHLATRARDTVGMKQPRLQPKWSGYQSPHSLSAPSHTLLRPVTAVSAATSIPGGTNAVTSDKNHTDWQVHV